MRPQQRVYHPVPQRTNGVFVDSRNYQEYEPEVGEDEEEDDYPRRRTTSRVLAAPLQPQSLVTRPIPTVQRRVHRGGMRMHPLTYVGVAMLTLIFAYLIVSWVVVPALQNIADQWAYGSGRVSHVKASLYPGKESDVYALAVQNSVEIVIITDSRPQGISIPLQSAQGSIVTVTTLVMNGKVNLLVHCQLVDFILYNHGGSFAMQP
jgi:hypothetical protein